MIYIKLYDGIKISNLELLGSGTQGKVYKINSFKCIKIFKHKNACIDEVNSLLIGQIDNHFPKIYSYGDNHIVRELITGQELNKYLQVNTLTESLAIKIIELYESMYFIGYNRLDTAIFHIFITRDNKLKLIDTSKAMKKYTEYPKLILHGLDELGYKNIFLYYVQKLRPDMYSKWMTYNNSGG